MKRVICIGNPLVAEDATGPLLYGRLQQTALPADVELIDGGVRGLDLLPFFEGAERVVLIDGVAGFRPTAGVVVLSGEELFDTTWRRFDHEAGIDYLLRMLPQVCEGPLPEIFLLGVEGCLSEKLISQSLERLQRLLEL